MDCIDLFKKAAMALQTDPRYLELDAARRENDSDQELQGLIGEFNLARLDLNNESAKPEPDTAHVAELNQQVNDLYTQIMSSEGMVRYNTAKAECEAYGQPHRRDHQHRHERRRPDDRSGPRRRLHRQLRHPAAGCH
ncbi:MAG: YlbF family regulator [Subdoligranulum sp.]